MRGCDVGFTLVQQDESVRGCSHGTSTEWPQEEQVTRSEMVRGRGRLEEEGHLADAGRGVFTPLGSWDLRRRQRRPRADALGPGEKRLGSRWWDGT